MNDNKFIQLVVRTYIPEKLLLTINNCLDDDKKSFDWLGI